MTPVEYINPWFAGARGQSRKFMATTRPTEYRGFKVYRQALGQYDYVFEGICVKQLGAFKKSVIDEIHEGQTDMAKRARDIINRHGVKL
jgi:hypothetical protein